MEKSISGIRATTKKNSLFHRFIQVKNVRRNDIKNKLNQDLTVLLYKNGYPPEWNDEIFEQVMAQAENYKKYQS